MLISVLNIKLTCEWHKAIKLNYKNTRTHVIVVLRDTKHFTCAVAVRNALEPAVDKDGQCEAYGYYVMRTRYSTWNRKKTTLFSRLYLRNRSTLDIGVLGYIGIPSQSLAHSSWDTLYIYTLSFMHIHKVATKLNKTKSESKWLHETYCRHIVLNLKLVMSVYTVTCKQT